MVSKTSEDLPEPETPVKIVIFRFGMRTFTFFRLFSLAPLMTISLACTRLTIPMVYKLNKSGGEASGMS